MKKLVLATALTLGLVTPSFAGGGGDILRATVMVDNLEYQFNDEKVVSWDSYAYIGYDLNKVYIYSEGEKADGVSAESENQLVYSRAISPYWDIQLGVGYDKTDESDQTWGVLGVQGLAPYFFETRIAMIANQDGIFGIRLDTEYEALITQKLIFSPSFKASIYSEELSNNVNVSFSLRYEFTREFAPYIAFSVNKDMSTTQFPQRVASTGLRFWFRKLIEEKR